MSKLVKILLIEDDKQVSEYVSGLLDANNYQVECAYDGETGRQKAIDKHYDLLIVDRMFETTGIRFALWCESIYFV